MVLPGTADTATTSATTGAASPATGTANADVATHRISGPRRWPTTPRAMAGALARWTRRPGARLALPGALLAVLLLGTGVAGALVVPSTAERAAAPQASPSAPVEPTAPAGASTPRAPVDIGGGIVAPTASASAGAPAGRPADVLRQWAGQMSPKVGVPQVALEAYGYAELVLAQSSPGCGLKWTTLAAIGKVESAHGSANGATLGPDGKALPRILGPPLNGQGGTMQIRDSDNGVLDGDRTWDRAVGPMQFIPGTWESQSVDADNDGLRDPSDVDDAALAAGNYLCRGNRNLNTVRDWWAAILTYNAVQPYAQAVYAAANDYGTRSRT